MSKEIVYENVETNWYSIDIFKNFDPEKDWTEQVNEAIKDNNHWKNDMFDAGSMREAVMLAEKLLSRDDDYNYAIITLNRYYNFGDSEEDCEDCVCVGELWSDKIKES